MFNYLYFFDQNLTTVTSSKATEIFYISTYIPMSKIIPYAMVVRW